jgi:isopenicillin N synthase-like dioxygenase
VSDHPIVPVIDVGPWPAGDAVERETIARAVDDACREVGFMQIVGHGIPDAAIAGLGEAIDWLFALPMEDKQPWRAPRPSINRGYTPPRSGCRSTTSPGSPTTRSMSCA